MCVKVVAKSTEERQFFPYCPPSLCLVDSRFASLGAVFRESFVVAIKIVWSEASPGRYGSRNC